MVKQKLEATFSCLFCNHEKSVICLLDKKTLIGSLKCKVCGQNFQTTISALSAPVDVYSDWVDVCEDINTEDKRAENDYGAEEQEDEDRDYNPRGQGNFDGSDSE